MKTRKWILLAEDDASLADLTTMALGADALACEVIVAHDGTEALDCLHHRKEFETLPGNPAFVLLDLKMPKLNGLEVLEHVRSDARLKNIPVVMFTSSRELADVRQCYQLGANAYVVKPADFHEFSETLRRMGQFWVIDNEPPPEEPARVEKKVSDPPQLAVTA